MSVSIRHVVFLLETICDQNAREIQYNTLKTRKEGIGLIPHFGEKLKNLRLERGLSQTETGALLGVDRSTISQYELGGRLPSYDILIKIANTFHVSADYLLGIGDYKDQKLVIDTRGLSENQVSSLAKIVNAVIGEMKRGPDDIFL